MPVLKYIYIFALLFVYSFPALALDLEGVRLGVHPDKTRIVIETSEEIAFKAFILHQPERLIIDTPMFIWQAGVMAPEPDTGILQIRYAPYKPGYSRIVFDLNQKYVLKSSFKLPAAAGGRGQRIVIDLQPATHQGGVEKAPVQTSAGTLGNLVMAPAKALSVGAVPKPPTPTFKPAPQAKPLIVIDAGHGGQDSGAISPQKLQEKDVVLSLARGLAARLQATGRYNVKLTRDSDRYIKLGDRVALSRKWGADMFISIHADSIDKADVRGASVYTLSNTASDAQTAKLAERENRADIIAGVDLSHEDKQVANILIDLAMRDTMNQSRFFANLLVSSFKAGQVNTLPNTHRYAGFAVLKAPDVPSVLVEAGFISNRNEALSLAKGPYRDKVINAIANGVDAYFRQTRS